MDADPAGYRIVDSQYQPTDWLKVIFNPSFVWRWWHLVGGVLLSAALGGTFSLHSPLGGGTTVTCELPVVNGGVPLGDPQHGE